MENIKWLIQEIENADRLDLSPAEVAKAKVMLKAELLALTEIVNKTLGDSIVGIKAWLLTP